jgi:hypothetical protein
MAKRDQDGVPIKQKKRVHPPSMSDFWYGDRGGFAGIPRAVMRGPDYLGLNPSSAKLLLEFAYQVNGQNNGDLSAVWSLLKMRGFNSKQTIERSINELILKGLIVKTRNGASGGEGYRKATLYALTWLAICPVNDDGAMHKLDVESTNQPLRISFDTPFDGRVLVKFRKNNLLFG